MQPSTTWQAMFGTPWCCRSTQAPTRFSVKSSAGHWACGDTFRIGRDRHMTTATETDVLVTRDGPVGIVTINRPQRLNAVTPAAGYRLSAAFRELEADPNIRAVVLTGAGRGVCAGADISGDVGNARDVLLETWNPLVRTMQALELPIIAALNGVAAGAGVSLALACDLRVAAESARIQLSFTKIGLLPDAGLTWLPARAGGAAVGPGDPRV